MAIAAFYTRFLSTILQQKRPLHHLLMERLACVGAAQQ